VELKSFTCWMLNNYEMKKRQILFILFVVFSIALTSCKKDKNENLNDYARNIAGTYNGTMTADGSAAVSASSILTKSSDTIVNLIILVGSNSIPVNGIMVNKSGTIYNLTYAGGSFEGKVEGNQLTWTLTAGSIVETFSGTK